MLHARIACKETYLLSPDLAKLKGEEPDIQGKTCSLQELIVSLAFMNL